MESLVPFAQPDLSGNEKKYLIECVDSGYVTHVGRFENAFEEAFSKRFGVPAIATSSGTGALHLSLLALGIGHGDEVLCPALTFGATAAVILAVGARPVFIDVDPETWGIDRKRVLASLNKKTRAILSVHLLGEDAGDFRQFGVPVIEDSCEALGMVPFRGEMACFSFYGNKTITTGEGGMLCGNLRDARKWRDGGFTPDYRNELPGLNYRMSNMQAAVGLAQMERFDSLLDKRLENAKRYSERLKGRGKWLFAAQTKDPIKLSAHLAQGGVQSRPMFTPLYRSPAFRVYAKGSYRVADWIWENHVLLPTGPHVSEEQITKITELVSDHQHLCERPGSGKRLAA